MPLIPKGIKNTAKNIGQNIASAFEGEATPEEKYRRTKDIQETVLQAPFKAIQTAMTKAGKLMGRSETQTRPLEGAVGTEKPEEETSQLEPEQIEQIQKATQAPQGVAQTTPAQAGKRLPTQQEIAAGAEPPSTLDYFEGALIQTGTEVAETATRDALVAGSKAFQKLPVVGRGSKIMTEGLRFAMGEPSLTRSQKIARKADHQLKSTLIRNYRQAVERGDEIEAKRLRDKMKDMEYTDIWEQSLKEAPTEKQITGAAGGMAAPALIAYNAGIPMTSSLPGKLGTLTKAGKVIVPEMIEEGIIMGSAKAMDDASTEEIVHSMEKGAAIGGVSMGAMQGLGYAFKGIKPYAQKGISKGIKALERLQDAQTTKFGSETKKVLSTIGEEPSKINKLKQKIGTWGMKTVNFGRKAKARILDKYHPMLRIEKKIANLTNRPLKDSEKIYRNSRLLRALSNADAEDLLKKHFGDFDQYSDETVEKAKAYLLQLDYIDRAKQGMDVPGGKSLTELKEQLWKLADETDDETMTKVGRIREKVRNFHHELLDIRVDAGLIDDAQRKAMLKDHPNYIPHHVLAKQDEEATEFMVDSFNVSKTQLQKAVGSVKDIEDPWVAMAQETPLATKTVNKNKLIRNLVDAQKKYDVMPGAKPLQSGEKAAENFSKINFFKNGTKQTWQVPDDIAAAVKNQNVPVTGRFMKTISAVQQKFKDWTTQYNLSFAIPNKFRDEQTAALTARGFIDELSNRYNLKLTSESDEFKDLLKKNLDMESPPDDTGELLKELYRKSGGFGASIFAEGDEEVFKKLNKSGIAEKVDVGKNPIKLMGKVNEKIEKNTRLKVFRQALQQGLDPKDAAMVSREASIDFARMGSWMEPVNRAIPFLNARVQGFANIGRSLVNSPEAFTRMQAHTAVKPAVLLHLHNRRFDSYKNMSQSRKDRNWNIMVGEVRTTDPYSGNEILVPQALSIPKAEGQSLVANPIRWFLEKEEEYEPRKVGEMIADSVGNASPIFFQNWNAGNPFLSLASQTGPVGSVPAGLMTKTHPYFGTKIIPQDEMDWPKEQQWGKQTSEIAKEVSDIINEKGKRQVGYTSPREIEFMMNSMGGLPKDAVNLVDMMYNVKRGDKIGEQALTDTVWGTLSELPVARRFAEESNPYWSPEAQEKRELKEKLETGLQGLKAKEQHKVDKIWNELVERNTKQDQLNYLNSLGDELTPEIRKELMVRKQARQTVEALDKNDSTSLRAHYIYQRMAQMKKKGLSEKHQLRLLNRLEKAGILTDMTRQKLQIIKKRNQ